MKKCSENRANKIHANKTDYTVNVIPARRRRLPEVSDGILRYFFKRAKTTNAKTITQLIARRAIDRQPSSSETFAIDDREREVFYKASIRAREKMTTVFAGTRTPAAQYTVRIGPFRNPSI